MNSNNTRSLIKIIPGMLFLMVLLLAACSGGGGSAPAGGGGSASYTVGGTVTGLTGSVVLQDNGGDNLTIAINGAFTFATPVASGSVYSVTVLTQPAGQTCTVTSGSGNVSGNVTNVAVACVSTAKAWGTAARIESGVRDAYAPQIAMDGSGNAFAVWRQYYTDPATTFSGYVVWANRYVAGTGWGTAAIINNGYLDSGFPPLYAQIAMDVTGNAIAVWEQYDPGAAGNTNITSIWANRYTAGTGWGTATVIENRVSIAFAPQVAINANGDAMVAWRQGDNFSGYSIWGNLYIAGTGWSTNVQIDSGAGGFDNPPQIAMDAAGNVIAVWTKSNGAIWANRYTAGTGWGTPASLVTSGRDPRIAMNAGGDAFVVWDTYDSVNANYSIWSKRYIAGTSFSAGWQPDELIDPRIDIGSAGAPQIAISAAGEGTAVWSRCVGTTTTTCHIYAIQHPAATVWGMTVPIDNNTGTAGASKIAVNANGDAFAVWYQFDGTRYNIWSNRRLAADTTWGTAELIETNNAGSAYDPQIVVDPNGNALSVWRQNDGTLNNIWANRFK
ncbi:MAG: hypothetical protein HY202_00010 [Nitrospirae bacterium]|nr:hypothetical protein [Nitrospirota bacterium]